VSIIEISLFFLLLSVLIFVLAEYFVWSPGHDDTNIINIPLNWGH